MSKNEKEEFTVYVRENMQRAYFSALALLGSHDDAMEASQHAFVRAYKHFGNFNREKKFFTWYYRILKNLCLNMIRDTKRNKSIEEFEYLSEKVNDEDVAETYELNETKQNLQRAIMMLDTENRELIHLREFEGYSYKEISELLEIPEGTVMSRLYYARKKLAETMRKVV